MDRRTEQYHQGYHSLFAFFFNLRLSRADMFYCIEFLWFQCITNTRPINHLGVWQTNHLLMKWGRREFSNCICLIYQVRSNSENPKQLRGNGREFRGITYSSAADSRRLLMEGEGKTKHKKGGFGTELHSGRVKEWEEERKRRESWVWCSDNRVHIWINASTKGNFLLAGSSSPL